MKRSQRCYHKEIKSCFRQDFDEWAHNSNLAGVRLQDGRQLKKPPHMFEEDKERALGEIWEVLREHPDADYFWYAYDGKKLLWIIPSDEPQPVPEGSLRTVSGMVRILIRDERLKELGL